MPKLPADLPENWTQGQTISPNGTEVGLTEQHGYNYLMKQVNNTQTEVNGINDALPDVAQEATVAEINDKIGTESDADTQPTLFGRLAQLKNVLLEKLAELLTKVTGMDGKIGTVDDTSMDETLFGKIADIVNKVNKKTVCYASDTVRYTNSELTYVGLGNSILLLKRESAYDGFVKIKFTIYPSEYDHTYCRFVAATMSDFQIDATSIGGDDYGSYVVFLELLEMEERSTYNGEVIYSDTGDTIIQRTYGKIAGTIKEVYRARSQEIDDVKEVQEIIIRVKKGEEYFVVLSNYQSGTTYIESVQICYDLKEV